MFKKVITYLLITLLILINISPLTSYGFTPEDTIKENLVKYNALNDEILELNSKIETLDIEINQLNTNLEENKAQVSQVESEITSTESKLEQTKEEIESSQVILDSRVRNMYKSNQATNILISIITSTSLSELIARTQAISTIISTDRAIIEDINNKKDELATTIENLSEKNEQLLSMQSIIEKDISEIEKKKASQEEYWAQLNSEMDSVFSIIEENEKQLISNPLSIANSSTASASQLQSAIDTLNALLPQLNSSSVINSAKSGISNAQDRIAALNTPITPSPGLDVGTALQTFTMESTAYYGHGTTAMGLKPVRDPNGLSTVAVDPSVIPLGSKVYVSGYGVAIASDTGGAIKGNKIDVFLNSYDECMSWGRKDVTVQLLAYPGEW